MLDAITKSAVINTDIDSLWQAITDHKQFGDWFMVALDGPFIEGELSHGQMTLAGYEHYKWISKVLHIQPQKRFAFYWSPAMDMEDIDFSLRPQTLVEFKLEPQKQGVKLTVIESGFSEMEDALVREEAMQRNAEGWEIQLKNIEAYVNR